jgi:hypothetical protein
VTTKAPADSFRILMGHPSVREYIRLVKTRSPNGLCPEELDLAQEWQRGAAVLRTLEHDDQSIYDVPELEDLPAELARHAEDIVKDEDNRQCLSLLPHAWRLIDLHRLIVWQKHVDCNFADALRSSTPAQPTLENLLAIASGVATHGAEVKMLTLGSSTFSFSSASTDLRILGAVPLSPENITGCPPIGKAKIVLGVFVGYGLNAMYAIHIDNRLMLINGTHRAYALMSMGINHVPCLVCTISNQNDLDLVGLPDTSENLVSLVRRRRPPLLKDFFNEHISRFLPVQRSNTAITLDLKFDRNRFAID